MNNSRAMRPVVLRAWVAAAAVAVVLLVGLTAPPCSGLGVDRRAMTRRASFAKFALVVLETASNGDRVSLGPLTLMDADDVPYPPPTRLSPMTGSTAYFTTSPGSTGPWSLFTGSSPGSAAEFGPFVPPSGSTNDSLALLLASGTAVEFEYSEEVTVASYSMTSSANASRTHDPVSWLLLGWDVDMTTRGGSGLSGNWTLLSAEYRVPSPATADTAYVGSPFGAGLCRRDIGRCSACAVGDSYNCTACAPGWSNPSAGCTTRIDPCAGSPCSGGGVCTPHLLDTYTCTCPSGQAGPTCATPSPPSNPSCSVSGCDPAGGSCVYNPAALAFECVCEPGRSGVDCASSDATPPQFVQISAGLSGSGSYTPAAVLDTGGVPEVHLEFSEPLAPLTDANRAAVAGIGVRVTNATSGALASELVLDGSRAEVSGNVLIIRGGWETLADVVASGAHAIDNGGLVWLHLPPGLVHDKAGNPNSEAPAVATVQIKGVCSSLPAAVPLANGALDCVAGAVCTTTCVLGSSKLPSAARHSTCTLASPTSPAASGTWSGGAPACAAVAGPPVVQSVVSSSASDVMMFAGPTSETLTLSGSSFGASADDLHGVWYGGSLVPSGDVTWVSSTVVTVTLAVSGPMSGSLDIATVSRGKAVTPLEFHVLNPLTTAMVAPSAISNIQSAITSACTPPSTVNTIFITPSVYTGSCVSPLTIPSACANTLTLMSSSSFPAVINCAGTGPGLIVDDANTQVRHLTFADVVTPSDGGAVLVLFPAFGTSLFHVLVGGAGATGNGGAIATFAPNTDIQFLQVQGSQASDGGALYVDAGASGTSVSESWFNLTQATNAGGAIYAAAPSFSLTSSSFDLHTATNKGGHVAIAAGATSSLIFRCSFLGGESKFGGILHLDSDVYLSMSTLSFSVAEQGGAVWGYQATLANLEITTVTATTGGSAGGAIFATAPITIRDSFFQDVAASHLGGEGGAIAVFEEPYFITGNVFSRAVTAGNGGAFAHDTVSRLKVSATTSVFGHNVITDGLAGRRAAGVYLINGRTSIEHNVFDGCSTVAGAALYIAVAARKTTAQFNVNYNVIRNGIALESGAGVFYSPRVHTEPDWTAAWIVGNWMENNVAAFGACVSANSLTRALYLTDNTFYNNAVTVIGGTVYIGIDAFINIAARNRHERAFALFVGGAVFVYAGSGYTSTDEVFVHNEALNRGGVVGMFLGEVKFERSVFRGNSGSARGGVLSVVQSVATVKDSVLEDNYSAGFGGAVEVQEGLLRVTNCRFTSNTADTSGGAIFLDAASSASVASSPFVSNAATERGGAIEAIHLELIDSTFHGNTARFGGAVYIEDATRLNTLVLPDHARAALSEQRTIPLLVEGLSGSGLEFINNTAQSSGGGMVIASATNPATLSNTVMTGNTAGTSGSGSSVEAVSYVASETVEGGGAIAFMELAKDAVVGPQVTLSHNAAIGSSVGGGLLLSGSSQAIRIEGLSVSDCETDSFGGGMFVSPASTAMMDDVTVSRCTARGSGGGLFVSGQVTLASKLTGVGQIEVTSCSAGNNGGGMYLDAQSSVSGRRVSVSQCSAARGGGIFAESFTPIAAVEQGETFFNSATMGGGALFLCFLQCGTPIPSSVDPGATFLFSGNTAFYGRNFASDVVSLEWLSRPWANVTVGEVLKGSDRVSAPAVVLRDLFSNVVASEVASSFDVVNLEIEHPTLGVLTEDKALLFLSGGTRQFVSADGEVLFSNVVVALGPGSLAEQTPYLDVEYLVRAKDAFVPELQATTSMFVSACAPGYTQTQSESGFVECSPCAPGTSSPVANGACLPCPVGSQAPRAGSSACTLCEPGTFASSPGQAACINCKPGQFSVRGSAACEQCPSGGFCVLGQLQPREGWWDPTSAGLERKSSTFFECPNPDACSNGECVETYTGPMCDKCVRRDANGDTWAKVGKKCAKCPSVAESIVLICLGLIALMAVLLYFVRSATKAKSAISILLKIVIDYAQTLALVSEFKTATKSTFSRFFSFTQTATTSVNVFPVACVWEYKFYQTFLLYATFPLVCCVVCGLIYGVVYIVALAKNTHTHRLGTSGSLQAEYLGRFVSTLTVIYFLAYPSVVKQLFQVYPCYEELGVLKADVSVTCYDATHQLFMTIGGCALFLYTIVIPGAGFYLLHHKARLLGVQQDEQERLRTQTIAGGAAAVSSEIKAAARWLALKLERYKFLIDGYRPRAIYWEMVIISRKTMIVLILVFLVDTRNTQAVFGVFVLMVYALMHISVKPFKSRVLNLAEFSSLTVLLITLVGSLAFIADQEEDTATEAVMDERVALALIALNAAFLMGMMFLALRAVRETYYELRQARRKAAAAKEAERNGDYRALDETSSLESSYFDSIELLEGAGEGIETALVVMDVFDDDDEENLSSSDETFSGATLSAGAQSLALPRPVTTIELNTSEPTGAAKSGPRTAQPMAKPRSLGLL